MNGEFADRLGRIADTGWGGKSRLARQLGVPQSTFSNYLSGRARPPFGVLLRIAEVTGVSLDWLVHGSGPMWRGPSRVSDAGDAPPSAIRVPVLGRVPAGPPGGAAWAIYDAPDVYDSFIRDVAPGRTIALRVMGDSMFPTLWEGDLVVTAVGDGNQWHRGDLVVAEIEEFSEDYLVKRLGQETRDQITLISDNFLHYEPLTLPRAQVEIRGVVLRVLRTPPRRAAPPADGAILSEFYQSPQMQEILQMLPELSPRALELVVAQVREMRKLEM